MRQQTINRCWAVASNFGEVCDLLRYSKLHQSWSLGKIRRSFEPPLRLGQYRSWRNSDGRLTGICAYALISDEILEKLPENYSIGRSEWKSGGNLWLAEFVAPFGHVGFMVRDTVRYFKNERGFEIGRWYRPAKQKIGFVAQKITE